MSDILTDAMAWLDTVPPRIGTHWPECHTDRHHAPCLLRKLVDEVNRLRDAIRRLAEQDATLSLLCKRDGSQVVTVTMDATLTAEERTLIYRLAEECEGGHSRAWTNRALTSDDRVTLRRLLERLA